MMSEDILEQHSAQRALIGSPLLERKSQSQPATVLLDDTPPTETDTVH